MADRDEGGRFLPGTTEAGRDSLYDPSMNEQATKLALLGMTDEEMAKFFGVTAQTFYNWQKVHQPFFEAVHAGKEIADAEVASALYRRATGVSYQVERLRKSADGSSEVVKLNVYEPPDTSAAKQWLANRRRQNWTDKVDVVHTGEVVFKTVYEAKP